MRTNIKKYALIFISLIVVAIGAFVINKNFGQNSASDNSGDNSVDNADYPYKISVIIPVYNAGRYLDKCLDSVENQTLKEIEIICVNDGSKDNSIDILKKHAANDNRIRIIDQENAGVSAARNNGIRSAKGEYITFVDADDYIETCTYKSCMDVILKENPDVFVYKYRSNEDEEVPQNIEVSKCNSYNHSNFISAYKNSHPAVWDKIFKRELLFDNEIFFKEDVVFAEDHVFTLMAFVRANKIVDCPNKFYYYRTENQNSIVNSTKLQKKMESTIKANKYLLKDFHNLGIYEHDLMFLEEFIEVEKYITEEVKDEELKNKLAREILDVY